MLRDFYVADRRVLAGRFEMEWFDHVLAQTGLGERFFEFPPFDPALLHSDSYEKVADLLSETLRSAGITPRDLLEVGSALGRGFYEVCVRTPSLRAATLVEPSEVLADAFDTLFKGNGPRLYPVLRGNAELAAVSFNGAHLKESVRNVEITVINAPHDALVVDRLGTFDLVLCSNVLDQCTAPLALVELLKRHTAPGGVCAVSCTYMWNSKYLGKGEIPAPFALFDNGWTQVNEANIPFAFRTFERHWWLFLSQMCVFRRD